MVGYSQPWALVKNLGDGDRERVGISHMSDARNRIAQKEMFQVRRATQSRVKCRLGARTL